MFSEVFELPVCENKVVAKLFNDVTNHNSVGTFFSLFKCAYSNCKFVLFYAFKLYHSSISSSSSNCMEFFTAVSMTFITCR